MTRFLLTTALAAFPFAALAQTDLPTTEQGFEDRMVETLTEARSAGIPVSCAGLFRALTQVFDAETEQFARFKRLEEDAALVAIVAHSNATGVETGPALETVTFWISAVTSNYMNWLQFNSDTTTSMVSDKISQNFNFCEGQVAEWRETMGF